MKLKSLIENGRQLEIAEVEIEFIPGLPQIHFLGLPDRIIKESFYRIKSALKSSGYKFPLTQQMIVNIKPSHLRKSSRGVELAVAIGILLKSKQIEADRIDPNWVLYGELGLDGSVYEPSDLHSHFLKPKDVQVLTGWSKENRNNYYRLHELKSFEIFQQVTETTSHFKRPQFGLLKKYTESEAQFLFLTAVSGLHGLLAGDSGAGKSTVAKAAISFLPQPTDDEIGRWKHDWRPVIMPHPTITAAAFLGGGGNLYQGEVERVQNGLLILDELLEFDSQIIETLRGPMAGEKLRLVRGSEEREIETSFQVIATTNFCPCGKWTPVKEHLSCRFGRAKCTRYLERLSGPFVDRFGLMMFADGKKQKRVVSGESILKRIENYQKVVKASEIPKPFDENVIADFYSDFSTRRLNFLTQIACVFAVERIAETSSANQIQLQDYNHAETWVTTPFRQLEKGMS